ncbi:MAG TPA: penicillin acylase family protein [Marmoricola sp.]|nr:penicillin acylase family protein [Marmoricola sp.]
MAGTVVRDRWGVPHVAGGSAEEVAFLQGRATVEDRAWQLEHARLKAAGRTASVLGAGGLPWDRFARRARLQQLARRAFQGLSEESARFVAAYVDGVNAGIADEPQAPELDELGIGMARWAPWTPLAVFAAHHVLFASFPRKLWRRHVEEALGREVADVFDIEESWSPGSNSWVVGGERTRGGMPMIGGDPHRTFESPNPYQQVRLTCTDAGAPFDVAGFTFPGVPGVQHFAHAGSVAWGITNAMADYQDLYAERLERRGEEIWAATPSGWEPATREVEQVEVRGAAVEPVEVVVTGHGPVVVGGPDVEPSFSLRTAAYVLGDLGFDCLLPLLRARTSADVEAALAGWVEPVNNLVVADVGGDVRQCVVGRVPARPEENRWRPVSATDPDARWTGWVTDLPHRTVPADGHLVTANHRMDESFDKVGVEFAAPSRARRIDALLTDRDDLTADDFAGIHRDDLAGQPAALVAALAGLTGLSERGEALRRELAGWDQRFAADSTTAAAYVRVRELLVTRLAAAEPFSALGGGCPHDPLFDAWFLVAHQLYLSLANLLSPRGRALVPGLEAHLVAAVEAAAREEPQRYGERHRYQPLHALGHLLDEPPPVAGDNDSVRCAGAVPGSRVAFRGSVARYVWDLAGLDGSGWVVPLGASGDPSSPHHHDQLDAWVTGRLLPLPFSQTVAGPGATS